MTILIAQKLKTLFQKIKCAGEDFRQPFPSFRGFEKASLHTFLASFWKKFVSNPGPKG